MTAKLSIRKWDTFYKSGVYAWNVLCLTPGDLFAVRASESPTRTEQRESAADQQTEVSNGYSRCQTGDASEALLSRKGEQQIGEAATSSTEGPNGSPSRGLIERSSRLPTNDGNASGESRGRKSRGWDETDIDAARGDTPVEGSQLLERMLDRGNLFRALSRVASNGGSPGADGLTVKALPAYLKRHWPKIRDELLAGTYRPQPVKRVEIDKPDGGVRLLGIPGVLDRLIQQALLQILQPIFEPHFSESSYGFRPGRSAHQAVARAQTLIAEGYRWVVDLDLARFFDRVNHDLLMARVAKKVKDKRVLKLIRAYLRAGVMEHGAVCATEEGTPQGGPLSPLLSNILLTDLDQELERRGHRFVRYADDANIYVRSERAGQRVKASLTRFLEQRLKLKVNEAKSAVDRPWKRKFLGFSFLSGRGNRRRVAPAAVTRFKEEVRRLTRRTRGVTLARVIGELKRYLIGWKAYFGLAEVRSIFKDLDKWINRRLRCYLWKQWGRARYRRLKTLGVSKDLAWNTVKSAHGPWRLSQSPGLSIALPTAYFRKLGVPSLC